MKKKRREFLKSSAVALTGTVVGGNLIAACASGESSSAASEEGEAAAATAALGPITAVELGYGFDALEPNIDAMTMEIHYGKHYQGYVRKFNAALEKSEVEAASMEELFGKIGSMGETGTGLRNNGGGAYNHTLFWEIMTPGGASEPRGELAQAIEKAFGDADSMMKEFDAAAKSRFGSGWAWLVAHDGKVAIGSTPNQDNPLMDVSELQGTPILGLDVWEHAYYLKYQNKRGEYISNWWNTVNWDIANDKYKAALEA